MNWPTYLPVLSTLRFSTPQRGYPAPTARPHHDLLYHPGSPSTFQGAYPLRIYLFPKNRHFLLLVLLQHIYLHQNHILILQLPKPLHHALLEALMPPASNSKYLLIPPIPLTSFYKNPYFFVPLLITILLPICWKPTTYYIYTTLLIH